jgi:hypothetical protein
MGVNPHEDEDMTRDFEKIAESRKAPALKKRTKAEIAAAERAEACAKLRVILKPGDTVYTVLNHVSRSGMSRSISLYTVVDGENIYLTGYAARALGEKRDKYDGITLPGCGMDMGFALVYNLGYTLWPNGFGILPEGGKLMPKSGEYKRPETKEEAHDMEAQGFKFCGRNGEPTGWDNNGGYALKQKWL